MSPSAPFLIIALVLVNDALCQNCGLGLTNYFNTRIVNGKDVKQGDFPWMVALMKRSSGSETIICSAFMIDSLHALTAAHCFEDFENPRIELYSARIGSTHYENGTRYGIVRIVIHRRYHYPVIYDDIAMITLDREVHFPGFYPVCLPVGDSHISDLNSRLLTITGWGLKKPYGEMSPVLKRLSSIPVVDKNECNTMYRRPSDRVYLPRGITTGILCAGFREGGKDSCNGDSGGPLMSFENGHWVVVGIISFGPEDCGKQGTAAGHTRITFYMNWIKIKMGTLCGVFPRRQPSLITAGGNKAVQGEFPWMVAILMLEDNGLYTFLCSGFLIDSRHVLSAAQCFRRLEPDLYSTRIGDIYHAKGKQYDVISIVRHEGYRENSFSDDIAMLTLDKDVQFRGFNPVCLPDDEIVPLELVGRGTTVAGWGATRTGGDMSPVLTLAERIDIISNEDCTRVLRDRLGFQFQQQFPDGVSSGFLCTGLSGGSDSCTGDAGGPLMLEFHNRWYAVGIVSFGVGCARPGFPAGYTRVTHYLDWIRRNMQT